MDLLAGFLALRISRFQVERSSLHLGPTPGPSFIQQPGRGGAGLGRAVQGRAGQGWTPFLSRVLMASS